MRVLHVVKTSDGARWAALQARHLVGLGVEVHTALPSLTGRCIEEWTRSGAVLHAVDLNFPLKRPWHLQAVCRKAASLAASVSPDLIHSHFAGTTLTLRMALGSRHTTPRIFQVPGPLHLEHALPRQAELALAGPLDYWIASSRCIQAKYRAFGICADRLFLSYYGADTTEPDKRTNLLRTSLGMRESEFLVGNISYMYPPGYWLGQTAGIKCHEDLIDAMAIALGRRADLVCALVGEAWGGARWYEAKLRRRAAKAGSGRIRMPGPAPYGHAGELWPDFDCVIHAPMSENCGGVVEPLLAGVPVVATTAGGLPEVVIDGVTGRAVPPRKPRELASAVLSTLAELDQARRMARTGQRLVRTMFDSRRTALEVYGIYRHILDRSQARPAEFDPVQHLANPAAHAASC